MLVTGSGGWHRCVHAQAWLGAIGDCAANAIAPWVVHAASMNIDLMRFIAARVAGAYAQDPQPLLYPQPAWSGVHTSSSSSTSSRLRLASTQQSSPGNNPLLAPNWQLKLGQLPLWDKIQPQHIQPAVETLIEEETASLELLEQDLLAGNGAISFDQIFKPLTQIQLRTDFVSGQFSHLSVSGASAYHKH
jgi:hypothetical protein